MGERKGARQAQEKCCPTLTSATLQQLKVTKTKITISVAQPVLIDHHLQIRLVSLPLPRLMKRTTLLGRQHPFHSLVAHPRSLTSDASRAPTVIPRSAAISRLDLIASAERIFYRYLSPAGNTISSTENHEIYLPPALRIHSFPLSSTKEPKTQIEMALMAQIPDIFHAQKEYCFRAMEQDAFPRFLRSKAFGNLTPISALVRLILGLIILWIGLAAAFSLIFLDITPKSKRFFLFIPFSLAVLFLVSHQYELDPILVFFGQSETTPFRTLTIREPYVKKTSIGSCYMGHRACDGLHDSPNSDLLGCPWSPTIAFGPTPVF